MTMVAMHIISPLTCIPEKPLVMISARFKGDKYEKMVRELASELKKAGVNAYIVEAGAGTTFGDKTLFGLHNMVVMVCFCTHHYGERTVSVYSSFAELNLLLRSIFRFSRSGCVKITTILLRRAEILMGRTLDQRKIN